MTTKQEASTIERHHQRIDDATIDDIEFGRIPSLKTDVYIGADPEMFFVDESGEVVPADTILPVEEDAWTFHKDGSSGTDVRIFADGMAAEMAVRYHTCRAYVADHLFQGIRQLDQTAQKHDLTLAPVSSINIPDHVLESASDQALEFGCAPELLAWDDGAPSSVSESEDANYRASGGHIHIGRYKPTSEEWLSERKERFKRRFKRYREMDRSGSMYSYENFLQAGNCDQVQAADAITFDREGVVQALDVVVANTLTLIDQDRGASRRRQMYGMAGAYRATEYGLEYRTLSNVWLRAPQLWFGTTEMLRNTIMWYINGELDDLLHEVHPDDVRIAINENDQMFAREIFEAVKSHTSSLGGEGCAMSDTLAVFERIADEGGVESFFGPIHKEWSVRDHMDIDHANGIEYWSPFVSRNK